MGNFEKIKVYGEKFVLDSDNFSIKSKLYEDFSIRHRETYSKCLKRFVESNKSLLFDDAILAQKICAEALKKAESL